MSKKTRILYLITKGNWGGAQKYVYDLTTHLPKSDYEIIVAYGEGEELAEKLREKNIRVIKLKKSRRDIDLLNDLGLFFDLIDLVREEKPNIVHLNSSKIGGLGSLAVRVVNLISLLRFGNNYSTRKIRSIFTAHGWAFNEKRPDWQKFFIWLAHWLTIIFCQKVITIAEREYQQALKMPFCQNKIIKIYNGIQLIDFLEKTQARQELERLEPRLAQYRDSIWCGTISELHKNKGADYMIEAIADLKLRLGATPIFAIIGEGEERNNLENLIAKKQLNNNVFLLGKLDDAKTLLKAFDIFTLTSRKEGLPFALLEAGLAELPVLATDVGGIGEVLSVNGEDFGTLVRPQRPKEISLALQKILADLPSYQNRARTLRKRVEKDFSFEQMIEKTEALYSTVAQ